MKCRICGKDENIGHSILCSKCTKFWSNLSKYKNKTFIFHIYSKVDY
jgi:hypothetical protein